MYIAIQIFLGNSQEMYTLDEENSAIVSNSKGPWLWKSFFQQIFRHTQSLSKHSRPIIKSSARKLTENTIHL